MQHTPQCFFSSALTMTVTKSSGGLGTILNLTKILTTALLPVINILIKATDELSCIYDMYSHSINMLEEINPVGLLQTITNTSLPKMRPFIRDRN